MDFKLTFNSKQREELKKMQGEANSKGDTQALRRINGLLGLGEGYRVRDVAKILGDELRNDTSVGQGISCSRA